MITLNYWCVVKFWNSDFAEYRLLSFSYGKEITGNLASLSWRESYLQSLGTKNQKFAARIRGNIFFNVII